MKQQKKLLSRNAKQPREYLNRESHYLWVKTDISSKLTEKADAAPVVALKHSHILLRIRPAGSDAKKEAILDQSGTATNSSKRSCP